MRNPIVISFAVFLILLQACTFTTTTQKMPVFSISTDSLAVQLNKLVQCENLNVNGAEITTNGKKQTILEIDVVNGKDIPGNEAAMIVLAKQIALQVKKCIVNENAYTDYKVLFITQHTHGITTENIERGKDFKNEELNTVQQAVKTI